MVYSTGRSLLERADDLPAVIVYFPVVFLLALVYTRLREFF